MRRGRLIDLVYDDESYVFARQLNAETIIVGINRQDRRKRVILPADAIDIRRRHL